MRYFVLACVCGLFPALTGCALAENTAATKASANPSVSASAASATRFILTTTGPAETSTLLQSLQRASGAREVAVASQLAHTRYLIVATPAEGQSLDALRANLQNAAGVSAVEVDAKATKH
jgi:hypothetical protein